MRRLTQKQDRFCWEYLELPSVTDAMIAAGYSPKYAGQNSDHVLNSAVVQARIQELKQKAEDESVMSVIERKRRLSDIARAVIPDFVGDDGIKVTKDIPNVAAVAEITTRTKLYRKGGESVVITDLKLHNPIPAIQELNKMEKVYAVEGQVNIDNRKIEIFVVSERAKELTDRILLGEKT